MKQSTKKYLLLFNCMIIAVVVVIAYVLDSKDTEHERQVSITTPIAVSTYSNEVFCTSAKAAVLIDAKSGAVLYEKNSHDRLPMASTTKIMTALCVIEQSDPDEEITVTKESAGIEGSSIYLKAGEKISVADLLYGLLLESGNDAAHALAVGVFGSERACTEYMNKRAHEMGLVCTNFENVHGLDSDNHYTTAYELALIAKEAMKNDIFRQIVSSKTYTTKGENPRFFSSHNRLLVTTDYVTGVKTGYTLKSGRCLVSSAVDGEKEYIAVTLCDRNDWNDHKALLTYAIDNYDVTQIASGKDSLFRVGFDNYTAYDDIYFTFPKGDEPIIGYKITIDRLKGIGRADYYADGVPIGHFGVELLDGD